MKFIDPEQRLRHYINIRSNHLWKLAISVFVITTAAVLFLFWDDKSLYPIQTHLDFLQKIFLDKKSLSDYVHVLEVNSLALPILWHLLFSALTGFAAALLSPIPWLKRPDRMDWIYIKEGIEVFEKAKAGIRALNKRTGVWKKKGIQIYKGVGGSFRLPFDLESKHVLALGSVGTGKTASMLHSVQSIMERGDKAIIYDYKGDMTSWLLGHKEVSLIGFADMRSDTWHIAKDINNPLLARELAQTLIKETSDPIWSSNARDVLSGAIEYLIATKPETWGFQDVSDLLKEDKQELGKKLKSIGHGAANTIIDKPKDDKGSASVISTVRSGAWIFDVLGQAWGNPCKGFSIREWLRDENPEYRIIILRNYPEISAVSNWLLGIMFNQVFGEVLAMQDSKTRRIWAIIDELATLPKIPRLPECLVASRSKGFRFLCGIQNFASMRETYGREIAQTILSQFTTKIICRVNDEDTATDLANGMGGLRKISKAEVNRVIEIDDKGEKLIKWDVKWTHTSEPTMLNNQVMNLPDPTETGSVTAWLVISGFPICKLRWNFLNTEQTAFIDVPVPWLNDIRPPKVEVPKAHTPKPFPKNGKLAQSKPNIEPDDFSDLDNIDDFLDFDEDL